MIASCWNRDQLLSLLEKKGSKDAPWLRTFQQEKLENFLKRGFPSKKDKKWRHTQLDFIKEQEFGLLPNGLNFSDIKLKKKLNIDFHDIVFVNGHYVAELSELSNLEENIELLNLKEREEELKEKITSLNEPARDNTFLLLNQALFSDAWLIKISEGRRLEKPLRLLHLTTEEFSHVMQHALIFIEVGQGSQLTLIEEFNGSQGENYFRNQILKVSLATNSFLNYFKIQNEGDCSSHMHYLWVEQSERSSFEHYQFDIGSAFSREEILLHLKEKEASCQLKGIFLGKKQQHLNHVIEVKHLAPHTSSNQFYKGIIDDLSHAVFDSRVWVGKGAVKANAQQVNKNLLLSDKAEIDTQPSLEIYTDDVQCSHGATVGQLNEEALFYLRSRGIENRLASEILRHAFIAEIFDKAPKSKWLAEVESLMAKLC